jgi:hypothetical protein
MLHTPANPDSEESDRDGVSPPATDLLLPGAATYSNYFILRSNLPGLSLEIEKPDMELPVLTFEFKAD